MVGFVIDEALLRKLSPEARREVLDVMHDEVERLAEDVEGVDWDPEGNTSYPLTEDEARRLIRGLVGRSRELLRAFCTDYDADGVVGRADIAALYEATGHDEYGALGREITTITQRLKNITDTHDAWLFNWRARDWQWDEANKTYVKGHYYISGLAIVSLRHAFGIDNAAAEE